MKDKSLDPRVNRIDLPEQIPAPEALDQWQTWEVFLQQNRGNQHSHAGIVHAPNAEMALLFAKEQYARRFKCVNIWVVKTADVHATGYEDADMFVPAFDKNYREAHGYREVRHLIDAWKKRTGQTTPTPSQEDGSGDTKKAPQKVITGKPKIIIGGKK